MHSTGKLSFRPDDAKFLKLKTANVDVDACLCLDCGSVRLMADTEKVKELTDKE
jgi:ferredoxin-like protein FixX